MRKILFVDDNLHLHNQLHDIFNKIGNFQVLGFEYGRELVKYYKEQHANKENIDLIFIDCAMTDLSGFDTLKLIKKVNPEVTVIMMTGVHRQNVIDGIKLGTKWFIWKPFDEENIKKALNKFNKGDKTKVRYKRGNEVLEAEVQF